jgi:hypothetical protein
MCCQDSLRAEIIDDLSDPGQMAHRRAAWDFFALDGFRKGGVFGGGGADCRSTAPEKQERERVRSGPDAVVSPRIPVVGSSTGAVDRRTSLGRVRGFPLRARVGLSVARLQHPPPQTQHAVFPHYAMPTSRWIARPPSCAWRIANHAAMGSSIDPIRF